MRKAIQILLFIISYIPLYVILFLQNLNDHLLTGGGQFVGLSALLKENTVSIAFLILIAVSSGLYWVLYSIVIKSAPVQLKVIVIKQNHDEHLSYLATYILPFVGLKFDTWQNIVATVALFYVLGHIYIKTNLILTNPTLTLFRFSISRVETEENPDSKVVIHKKRITSGNNSFIHIIDNIYILKP